MVAKKKPNRRAGWHRLQVNARRLLNRLPLGEIQKTYLLTLIIGLFSGLAVVLFNLLLEFFQSNIIYRVAAVAMQHRWALLLVVMVPGLGALVAHVGLKIVAPAALGSGVSQVKKATHMDGGRIPANVIWGKMFFVALNIGCGASLGPEGPAVQIAAAIASFLGRLFTVSRQTLSGLLPVGAAAGLAAVFNTPISAVTFTIEDIIGDSPGGGLASRPIGSIVVASVIAAVIERAMLGGRPEFSPPHYTLNRAIELVFYAALGLVIGLASVIFKEGVLRMRQELKSGDWIPAWLSPGVGGLIVGLIGVVGLIATGSPSVLGIGHMELVRALEGSLPLKVLVVLGICKLLATMVSAGSGSPGGLFAPALYIGGMLGGGMGVIEKIIVGDHSAHPGAFALVGMGAAFAGVIRAPVTSIIIIWEMTGSYEVILPVMIANITSYMIASRLSPESIYDAFLTQDGVHLPQLESQLLRQIPVSRAMSTSVATISSSLTVDQAFHFVQELSRHHHAYPVLDANGELAGLLTFNDLKRALADGKADVPATELTSERDVIRTYPDQTLAEVILSLGRNQISQLPVVSPRDSQKLVGIITMRDVAQALARESSQGPAATSEASAS
jgi:CIC family chloride channel protein